jgi:hypothetical protein
LNEMVTAGNCPCRLTASASLRVCTRVKALKGTGVCNAALLEVAAAPAPPAAAVEGLPSPAAMLPAAEPPRAPPPTTVLAACVLDAVDNAEVTLVLEVSAVPRAVAVSAEVVAGAADTPLVEEAVRSALPVEELTPEPAPEEEPAVLGVAEDADPLASEDWI